MICLNLFCLFSFQFISLTGTYGPCNEFYVVASSASSFFSQINIIISLLTGLAGVGFTPHVITVKAGEVNSLTFFFLLKAFFSLSNFEF